MNLKKSDVSKGINFALELIDKLPINIKNVSFKDIDLIALSDFPLHVADLSAKIKKTSIGLSLNVHNVALDVIGIKEKLDELSFKGQITNKQINVVELIVYDKTDRIKLEGNIITDELSYLGIIEINSKIERLSPLFIKAINKKVEAGRSFAKCEVQGEFLKFASLCNIELSNFVLPLIYGEKLNASVNITNESVKVNSVELHDKEQYAKVLKPFKLINYNNIKKWPIDPIEILVKNYELDNALWIAKDVFKPLDGKLSGKLTITKFGEDLKFDIHNGGKLTDVKVNFGGKTDFVNIAKVNIGESRLILGNEINVLMDLFIDETKFLVEAKVNNQETKIIAKNAVFNFQEIGPVAGFKVAGKGSGDIIADGKSQYINIKSRIDSFSFEGFELDEVVGEMEVVINENIIKLNGIKGKAHQSLLFANLVVNTKNLEIQGEVKHDRLNFLGASRIYAPIVSKMEIPFEVIGDWKANYKISGYTTLEGVKIDGKFSGKNNYLMNENFELLNFNFKFINKILLVSDLSGKKGIGSFAGNASVDLNSNVNILTAKTKNIPLSEIKALTKSPIAIDGMLNGHFTFQRGSEVKYVADLEISETVQGEKKFGNSKIALNHNKNKTELDLNLLGDQVVVKGLFDWQEDISSNSKDSKLEAAFNISNLNELLGVFTFIDPNLTGVTSSLHLDIISDFNVNNYSHLDLDILINELIIKKRSMQLIIKDQREPQIIVENGLVKKWDINFKGEGLYIISHAKGDFLSDYFIKTRVKFGAELLEVISSYISRSEGNIIAYFETASNQGIKNSIANLVSEDLAISSERFPTAITKASMKLSLNDNKLVVEKFDANLIAGNLKIVGDVDFNDISPIVNLKYQLSEAGITMFKKTNFVLSGQGSVIGRNKPYSLGGDLQISRLVVGNEFTDFLGQNAIQLADIKFLPSEKKSVSEKYLNLKLTVSNNGPYMISNSMAQIGMQGILNVTGDERDYRLAGKLELAPLDNKIRFKNNEYNLTIANFYFSDQKKYTMPDFELKSNSKISNYKINIGVTGNPKNYRIDMTSEPTLGRESIFSLIAFGYTDDLQSKLTDDEKNNMRTAGVGALLFDRFKINETLKKEFGLQVNVGTEISKDNQNTISSQTSSQAVGQVRSATTIEVKKQIAKDVRMSVMSTVGGTSGQRQSMNLNYNVNDVISVEGIYEKKTNINQEQVIDGTSVGADLKMKWTFK